MISMMTDSITMIGVKCPLHHQEVGRTPLDSKMIDASTVLDEGFLTTQENQALMRDPFPFRVWSTGTELTEKAMTEMSRPICDPIQKELEGPTKDRPAY